MNPRAIALAVPLLLTHDPLAAVTVEDGARRQSEPAPQSVAAGQADRQPSIGVTGRFFSRGELRVLLNQDYAGGLLVEIVTAGSPAAAAGLRGGFIPAEILGDDVMLGGDLILAFHVPEPCLGRCLIDAPRILAGLEEAPVTFLREGRMMTAVIRVSPLRWASGAAQFSSAARPGP